MKYSAHMLAQLINSRMLSQPDDFQKHLIAKVCEVEEVHLRTQDDLLVIGKVKEVKKHPQADKLVIVQVDCGSHGQYQICTWGENVEEHTYVPVALPGCYLPHIDLRIEERTMRGEASNGMICSKEEMWIPEDTDQHRIWTMDHDLTDITDEDIWRPVADKYPRMQSWMMEVENKTITHRADLFGHRWLAYEVLVLDEHAHLTPRAARIADSLQQTKLPEPTTGQWVSREIDACNVYHLLHVTGLQDAPMPMEYRAMLYELGIQPKGTLVDISNYWMMLTGQPIHCFDADKVVGDIVVRWAKPGEAFVDLQDQEHTLDTQDIVIADQEKILALAWVIWGKSSAVSSTTTNMYVEVAHFDPVVVRKTAVRYGLRTDAASRYEKYINPAYTHGIQHALQEWLAEILWPEAQVAHRGASVHPDIIHERERYAHKQHMLDWEKISKDIYGTPDMIDKKHAREILQRMWCTVEESRVYVPSRRTPQERNTTADIVEEIARHIGFDHIPAQTYMAPPRFVPYPVSVALYRQAEKLLTDVAHMHQVETYPRTLPHHLTYGQMTPEELLEMENPLTPDQRYLRSTMIWHLIDIVAKNLAGRDKMMIGDIGNIRDTHQTPTERMTLSMVWREKTPTSIWSDDLFLRAKGHVTDMVEELLWGIPIRWELVMEEQKLHAWWHPLQQIKAYIATDQWSTDTEATWNAGRLPSQPIASCIKIHPYILHQHKIPADSILVAAEVDMEQIIAYKKTYTHDTTTQENGTQPPYLTYHDQLVVRDASFIIPIDQSFGTLVEAAQNVPHVRQVEVWDIYVWERIPPGYKSICLSCLMQGDGTRTTEHITTVLYEVIAQVEAAGWKLRE